MEIIARDDIESRLPHVKKIYSHSSCGDGICSAMICAAAYRETQYEIPEIKLIQYDTDEHRNLEPEPNCMFIDITPYSGDWQKWIEFKPVVLDHHDSVKYVTEGLGGIYGSSTESGATLAYYHVMEKLTSELLSHKAREKWLRLAKLAAIRDTWQKKNEFWINALELSQGMQLFSSKELIEHARQGTVPFEDFYKFGKKLYEKMMRKAELLADGAYIQTSVIKKRELKIGFVNCTEKFISEVCDVLLEKKGCDIAVSYFVLHQDGKQQVAVSIRSRSKDLPVNEVAKIYSGGGHVNAAGFRIITAFYPLQFVISDVCKGLDRVI